MESDDGQATWGWLLGDGNARGIALIFFFSGLALVALALLAFTTRSYRLLSAEFEREPPSDAATEASDTAPAQRTT
jgi:DHA3 family multidrug efflux protein-like MFS transporter